MILHNVEEREFSFVQRESYLALWLILVTFSLGLFALWARESFMIPGLLVIGYLAVFVTFGRTIIVSRDIFNPLCLVLFIGFVRFSCQAFLLLAGQTPPENMALFYELMGLSDSDWRWAHVLALTSLAGVALGWLVVRGQLRKPAWLRFFFIPALSHAAALAMLVGLAALFLFIVKNASLSAIVTGAMRSTTIQEGTGIYYRLSFMLIAGSILLSAYLIEKNRRRIALIPALVCVPWLLTLGGRGTAVTPVLAGLLLLWYGNREQKSWPAISFKLVHLFAILPCLLFATWLFYFIGLYRGGHGLGALAESLSLEGIWAYAQYSIFSEIGHLHGLAGAVAIGPGVLEGATFFHILSFPLSRVLPISGRSPGIFIVETLVGFPEDRRWGLHASLIGDAYLNFGLYGILVIMPLFGMLIKLLYAKFRRGTLHAAVYAFASVYGVNLFLKSIDAWENMLVGLVFMLIIIRAADVLNFRQRAFA